MSQYEIAQAAIAVLSLVFGGGALVKWLNRRVDEATARKTDTDAVTGFVDAVHADNAALRGDRDAYKTRAESAEEECRTYLVMAAAHEVWDVKALPVLHAHDEHYPPPPPLHPPPHLEAAGARAAAQAAHPDTD